MQTRMQTVQIEVNGLGASGTVRGVRSALECIRGVERVGIVPDDPWVTVTYDAHRVRPAQFETAIRVMGCEVERIALPTAPRVTDSNAARAETRLAS